MRHDDQLKLKDMARFFKTMDSDSDRDARFEGALVDNEMRPEWQMVRAKKLVKNIPFAAATAAARALFFDSRPLFHLDFPRAVEELIEVGGFGFFDELEPAMMELWHLALYGRKLLPNGVDDPEESRSVALDCPKTAALIFDRIWKPEFSIPLGELPPESRLSNLLEAPEALSFCNGSDWEVLIGGMLLAGTYSENIQEFAIARGIPFPLPIADGLKTMERFSKKIRLKEGHRRISSELARQGFFATPILGSTKERADQFGDGRAQAVICVLESLPLPIEQRLSWEQVLHFREDLRARHSFRVFSRWLDSVLPSNSMAQIEDDILIKLENYSRALARHGIKTRVGCFERIVSMQSVGSKAAAAGLGAAVGEPMLGLLGAGSVLLGEVAVAIQKAKLDLDELRVQHQDISYVFELRQALEENTDND